MTSHTFVLAGVIELGDNKYREYLLLLRASFDVGPKGIGPKIRGIWQEHASTCIKYKKSFICMAETLRLEKHLPWGSCFQMQRKKTLKCFMVTRESFYETNGTPKTRNTPFGVHISRVNFQMKFNFCMPVVQGQLLHVC